jgi:hypothetical protein
MKSASWLNVLVGVWLIVSAFVLPHTTAVTINNLVFGILLAAFSFWVLASAQVERGAAVLDILCAIWLIIAPFILAFRTPGPTWNSVICGLIALFASAVILRARPPRIAA